MIDIHSHILPGVDDGAKNLDESLKIARQSEKQGIKGLVVTPHCMDSGYYMTPSTTIKRILSLQQCLYREGINIRLYPGAEVFITIDLADKVQKKQVLTLNHGSYILIELPTVKIPKYTESVLYKLKTAGYNPIISHPERYKDIAAEPDILYYWFKNGIYAQVNASSLLGKFGKKVKKTAELFVKNNLVQLIGSDVHSISSRNQCLQEGLKRVERLSAGSAEIMIENNSLLIKDKQLNTKLKPQKETPGIFTKIKNYAGTGVNYLKF
ncbi:MAG: tyrosine-protein phosphatase [Halothermotrichaceae bacterium]